MTYVLFRADRTSGMSKEIYVDGHQPLNSTLVEVTDDLSEAMRFDTSRDAYEYGRFHGCDWWKVGKR